ncbi:MAG: dihydrofolate reductase family protein [Nitrososphaerales archaeon]
MRRVIASEFVSADGYIVGSGGDMSWVMKNFNDEMGEYAGNLMQSMDAVLLGRATYQIMAGAWPNLTEEQSPGADKMNGTPKFVLSRTLEKAPWGSYEPATIIGEGVERRVRELKERPGKNMVIYGSANAVQSLTGMGLIDEYQLLVHPVFLGGGTALFREMERPVALKLARTQTYRNGVNVLCYEPVPSEA